MTDPVFPLPDDRLERFMRVRTEQEAQHVDIDRFLQFRSVISLPSRATRVARSIRQFAVGAAIAAMVILLVAVVFTPTEQIHASPAEVVQQLQEVTDVSPDRTYLVRTEVIPSFENRVPQLLRVRETVLHLHGEKVVLEMPNRISVWGKDEAGRLWIVPHRKAAVLFEIDEIPELAEQFFALRAIQIPKLLREGLEDNMLSWGTTHEKMKIIHIQARNPHRIWREMVLKIDTETMTIQELSITRRIPVGELKVQYLLQSTQPFNAEKYTPEGHLDQAGLVFDSQSPNLRKGILNRYLRWLQPKQLPAP
ncbi:MAG: hypothetical protein R3B84_12300 [Zavarzinella sp.]